MPKKEQQEIVFDSYEIDSDSNNKDIPKEEQQTEFINLEVNNKSIDDG